MQWFWYTYFLLQVTTMALFYVGVASIHHSQHPFEVVGIAKLHAQFLGITHVEGCIHLCIVQDWKGLQTCGFCFCMQWVLRFWMIFVTQFRILVLIGTFPRASDKYFCKHCWGKHYFYKYHLNSVFAVYNMLIWSEMSIFSTPLFVTFLHSTLYRINIVSFILLVPFNACLLLHSYV